MRRAKIFHVPETERLSFEELDFVIDALDHFGGERVVKVIQDAAPMRGNRAGKLFETNLQKQIDHATWIIRV